MWNFKAIISCFLFLLSFLVRRSECSCKLALTPGNKPLLTQTFGSKVIIINIVDNVLMDEDDEMQAYCASGFQSFSTYDYNGYERVNSFNLGQGILNFKCLMNKVNVYKPGQVFTSHFITDSDEYGEEVENDDGVQVYSSVLPVCNGKVYAMFESRHKLPNCENALSYALAAKLNTPIIKAGLCYDLDKLSLKYVSYKLHEPSAILENAKHFYPVGLRANSLAEPLKTIRHLFKFPNALDIAAGFQAHADTNFWLQIANYDLENIIQTSIDKTTFDEFKDFFNTIWWRSLRTGNWRRFIQLLENRANTVTYNVYTGTSGTLRVPIERSTCEKETSKELHLTSVNTRVPQFIWTYLLSTTENVIEDFVVIAYNSPYFEYFDRNSTVICNDMCDEIDWLQPMQDSRNISALGLLYCCRSEEVIGLLDGFPLTASGNQTNVILETTVPL